MEKIFLLVLIGHIHNCSGESNPQQTESYEQCVQLGEQAVKNYNLITAYRCVEIGKQ